jgi:hypothetical protein
MKVTTGLLLALAVVVGMAGAANAAITINELKVKGTEYVELYNDSVIDTDVTGWTLVNTFGGGGGSEALAGIIPAGGFLVVNTTLDLDNSGDIVELYDLSGALIDDVGYGRNGGAPLGFNSIGRSPDGDDTDDWARDFEYADDNLFGAGAETPGAPNIQGEPTLGSDLLINEIDCNGIDLGNGSFDHIELYNPTAASILIEGYWVSDGDGFCQITAPLSVPAGGYLVLEEDAQGEGMDCTGFDDIDISCSSDVVYFYTPQGVRLDQLGLANNNLGLGETLQRCQDGAGPNDGFDYPSSGGDVTYYNGGPTLGSTNNPTCAVQTEPSTWGRMKGLYR